jgi:hypothetical protein
MVAAAEAAEKRLRELFQTSDTRRQTKRETKLREKTDQGKRRQGDPERFLPGKVGKKK